MRHARLAVAMLRYRVASMIWMFMLLGVARHGGLERPSWRLGCATLALAATYVAATTANDVADREIDRVNHPRDRGRPLVSGMPFRATSGWCTRRPSSPPSRRQRRSAGRHCCSWRSRS